MLAQTNTSQPQKFKNEEARYLEKVQHQATVTYKQLVTNGSNQVIVDH